MVACVTAKSEARQPFGELVLAGERMPADQIGDRPLSSLFEIIHTHRYAVTCINMQMRG